MRHAYTGAYQAGPTSKQLADWQTRGTGTAAHHPIAAHVSHRATYQARLAAYGAIGVALRMRRLAVSRITPPWQAFKDRLPVRRRRERHPNPSRHVWRYGLLAAAVLIVVGGFALLLRGLRSMSAPQPVVSLSWLRGHVPPGIADQYTRTSWRRLPIAPSDGSILYGCVVPTPQTGSSAGSSQNARAPQVWVTHDRALRWEQVGTLPSQRSDANLCYLTVDSLNPATLIAVVAWPPAGNHPTPDQTASYLSVTGGQTWQALSDLRTAEITRLVTVDGIAYAFLAGNNAADRRLMASTDSLRTWHPVDQGIVATGQHVWDFGVEPGTRTILAEVGNDGVPTRQLWITSDGGQDWNALAGPVAEQYVVATGTARTLATVCAGNYDVSRAPGAPNQMFCSVDSGAHWHALPGLNLPAAVAAGPARVGQIAPVQLLGITSDGAVLALDDGFATPRIYRLPTGARRWQVIGSLPTAQRMVVLYVPSAGRGMLWASNAGALPVVPEDLLYTSTSP